jgi:hypothetical protein
MPVPRLTVEHRHDRTKADKFMEEARLVFREMSAILGGLALRHYAEEVSGASTT